MTNKTEKVSVPRELLERATCQDNEAAGRQARIELCDLLDGAAPAEDVRAVGEEPVADLKRFDWDRDGGMVEDSTGEYVRWSDIQELNK